MLEQVAGNILESHQDIICQAVNCCGVMGAGLAWQIRQKYPAVYTAYRDFYVQSPEQAMWNAPKHSLLGQVQYVKIETGRYIANLFTQAKYGRERGVVYTDYDAVKACLQSLAQQPTRLSIAIPYGMCCGLAGGDWDTVLGIIQEVFSDTEREVIIYRLP